ncbi:MAG: hypothetical protein ACT4O3_05375 [Elusimicrobiota bacterium]
MRRSPRPLLLAALLFGALAWPAPAPAADVNTMVRNGLKLYEKGQYNKAIKQFVKVLQLEPNHAQAREYMMLCSKKIVEKKLGKDDAALVEQQVEVDKQIQLMKAAEPAPEPPADDLELADLTPRVGAVLPGPVAPARGVSAKEALQQRDALLAAPAAPAAAEPGASAAAAPSEVEIPASALLGAAVSAGAPPAAPVPALSPDDDIDAELLSRMEAKASRSVETRDILDQRDEVSQALRRRHLGLENALVLEDSGGRVEIVAFLNRLFLPHSDVLRDEAYAVLNGAVEKIRSEGRKKIVLKAVDSAGPTRRSAMPDLPGRRCVALFSYLIHGAHAPLPTPALR